MSALVKPIPALYTVYILRSTVRPASLYIGSTPNPPRRLKQHNGEVKGGAARTSRGNLRPWEMVAIVSGFPGMLAALKFEWALTNSHTSLHIPDEDRITVSTQRKKNGHPKRPPHSLSLMLSNLHLLLRVPSFARWPLTLHFYNRDVHEKWEEWVKEVKEPIGPGLSIETDFGPEVRDDSSQTNDAPWGIRALPLNYKPLRDYAEKARNIFTFEREGNCVHCEEALPPGKGLYAVCPSGDCEAVGHLTCWSRYTLAGEDRTAVLPVQGKCPTCKGPLRWGTMMKELTLRVRDPKEVDKLLKRRKAKT
ncbi:related to Structure-specific endonuclease subunit SLX1 [Cephalotrichum gorgonifer]|uniref:Related to Structure-specific endonuclease subunit SLX1 n=1 Tax=Cephalotrichum gorgonifer TaxID=2041049 RepID=A0AAE8SYP6_9PEZI|nr:related to Structure-specific endonuclease subunit SLX1 [Cephalotrichum gorgonifer]